MFSFSVVAGCADAINSAGPHTTALRDVTPRVIDGEKDRDALTKLNTKERDASPINNSS